MFHSLCDIELSRKEDFDNPRKPDSSRTDKKLGELVDGLVFPHIHSDQGLDLALERMGANQLDILPVVNRANVHQLEGVVTLKDVLEAYGVHRA